jgi:hypothetical protein
MSAPKVPRPLRKTVLLAHNIENISIFERFLAASGPCTRLARCR